MDLFINYSGKNLKINARNLGFFFRFIGLMFKGKDIGNLLFDFREDVGLSIHSLFVFFPFLAIWLDSKNNVLECRIVRPFCFNIKPKRNFRKLVEIPLKYKNEKIDEILSRISM